MTISSTTRKAGPFTGNGTANTFPFAFKVFASTDVVVVKTTTATGTASVLVMGTDYTVSLNADQNASPGGNVVLTAGNLPAGYTLALTSDVQQLQPTDFTNQGGFYPAVLNQSLDRLTILNQQTQEQVDRSIKIPLGETNVLTLPSAAARARKGLVFDDGGNLAVSADLGDLSAALAQADADAATSTANAGIATAQAGIATTQAGLATTAKTAAQTAQTGAETALASAQLLITSQRFATKATMDASLAFAAGTFAVVYADATPTNNQIYYKVGASGSGSWTAYQGDRITIVESQTVNYRAAGDPIQPALGTTTSWQWNITDAVGKVAAGVRDDGTFEVAKETIAGTSLAAPTLTVGYEWTVEDATGHVAIGVRRDGSVDAKINGKPNDHPERHAGGRFAAQINYICGAGQSNQAGTSPAVTTTVEYDNVSFLKGAVSPTVFQSAVAGLGEDPTLGLAGHCKLLLLNENGLGYVVNDYQLLLANNGVVANTIDQLSKGGTSGAFEAAISQVTSGLSIATQLGKTFTFSAVTWTQGEADNGMAEATYRAKMETLADNYNTDGKAITGQAQDIAFITYQVASDVSPNVAVAQWKAGMEHPLIYLACPTYFFNYADFQHLAGASTKWMGGYYGLVYKRVVIDRVGWEPLQPRSAQIVGNNIDLYFNKKGLALDTTLMPAQTNYGFDVTDGSGVAQTISSVTLLPNNRVRLAMAATPAAGWHARYGHNSVTGKSPFVGGGGNLRDTQKLTYLGNPMHNWCVIFDWTI